MIAFDREGNKIAIGRPASGDYRLAAGQKQETGHISLNFPATACAQKNYQWATLDSNTRNSIAVSESQLNALQKSMHSAPILAPLLPTWPK